MKLFKIIPLTVVVLIISSLLFNVSVSAQDKKEMSKEEMEMMKKWQEFMTPGPNHKYLEYFVGEWDSVATYSMNPNEKPMSSKIETKHKMILGGRYLKGYFKGMMMGQNFEGVSTTGFNNMTKKFTTIFFDNLGTGFTISHGTLDKTGKIRTETGDMDDPMTGMTATYKTVTTIVDQNKYTFEMYNKLPDGKEFKTFEIVSTRKK
jgi:hypothetical protein